MGERKPPPPHTRYLSLTAFGWLISYRQGAGRVSSQAVQRLFGILTRPKERAYSSKD